MASTTVTRTPERIRPQDPDEEIRKRLAHASKADISKFLSESYTFPDGSTPFSGRIKPESNKANVAFAWAQLGNICSTEKGPGAKEDALRCFQAAKDNGLDQLPVAERQPYERTYTKLASPGPEHVKLTVDAVDMLVDPTKIPQWARDGDASRYQRPATPPAEAAERVAPQPREHPDESKRAPSPRAVGGGADVREASMPAAARSKKLTELRESTDEGDWAKAATDADLWVLAQPSELVSMDERQRRSFATRYSKALVEASKDKNLEQGIRDECLTRAHRLASNLIHLDEQEGFQGDGRPAHMHGLVIQSFIYAETGDMTKAAYSAERAIAYHRLKKIEGQDNLLGVAHANIAYAKRHDVHLHRKLTPEELEEVQKHEDLAYRLAGNTSAVICNNYAVHYWERANEGGENEAERRKNAKEAAEKGKKLLASTDKKQFCTKEDAETMNKNFAIILGEAQGETQHIQPGTHTHHTIAQPADEVPAEAIADGGRAASGGAPEGAAPKKTATGENEAAPVAEGEAGGEGPAPRGRRAERRVHTEEHEQDVHRRDGHPRGRPRRRTDEAGEESYEEAPRGPAHRMTYHGAGRTINITIHGDVNAPILINQGDGTISQIAGNGNVVSQGAGLKTQAKPVEDDQEVILGGGATEVGRRPPRRRRQEREDSLLVVGMMSWSESPPAGANLSGEKPKRELTLDQLLIQLNIHRAELEERERKQGLSDAEKLDHALTLVAIGRTRLKKSTTAPDMKQTSEECFKRADERLAQLSGVTEGSDPEKLFARKEAVTGELCLGKAEYVRKYRNWMKYAGAKGALELLDEGIQHAQNAQRIAGTSPELKIEHEGATIFEGGGLRGLHLEKARLCKETALERIKWWTPIKRTPSSKVAVTTGQVKREWLEMAETSYKDALSCEEGDKERAVVQELADLYRTEVPWTITKRSNPAAADVLELALKEGKVTHPLWKNFRQLVEDDEGKKLMGEYANGTSEGYLYLLETDVSPGLDGPAVDLLKKAAIGKLMATVDGRGVNEQVRVREALLAERNRKLLQDQQIADQARKLAGNLRSVGNHFRAEEFAWMAEKWMGVEGDDAAKKTARDGLAVEPETNPALANAYNAAVKSNRPEDFAAAYALATGTPIPADMPDGDITFNQARILARYSVSLVERQEKVIEEDKKRKAGKKQSTEGGRRDAADAARRYLGALQEDGREDEAAAVEAVVRLPTGEKMDVERQRTRAAQLYAYSPTA